MKNDHGDLRQRYARALREHFSGGGEVSLLEAYEVGRTALREGLNVLDMAALHQEALVAALLEMLAPEASAKIARRASEFFAESLAPFEMTRRGYLEANLVLANLNRDLEERVQKVLGDYVATSEKLVEHQRLEQLKNEFISVVSHELRTPLTSIHGALGLIQAGMGGTLEAKAAQLLDVAYRNSQRLVRLVTDVLDLQKIEAGVHAFDIQPRDITSLLEQALEANQAYAAQLDVALRLEEAPRGDHAWADADRFMQVMANLISNAAKFSPPGAAVKVAACRRGEVIRISVTDEGTGIAEEFQSRVFEKFTQAVASSPRARGGMGGTGLGLSISKAIVERMGGQIGFESRVGAGTTFHFELPAADVAARSGRSPNAE